ncbi:YggT family protein [Fluviispira sanaruensis]|uniref:YggT family protein n=1 Tax=Fluviispira sanaruensis TaxID=2493639 RepID=A0A4P2VWB8_FLUSA|nr:YggT family protein [Fluviispira sanaruensis]BBH53242.1 hypothetical protein JCM31447_16850 [Fluviispira sanaruensis]
MLLIEIIFKIAYYLLYFYMLCLVITGVLSLVGANPSNPIVGFLNAITAPPCRALVKKFPKLLVRNQQGYYDLSPMVLILAVGCLMIVIQTVGSSLGFYI